MVAGEQLCLGPAHGSHHVPVSLLSPTRPISLLRAFAGGRRGETCVLIDRSVVRHSGRAEVSVLAWQGVPHKARFSAAGSTAAGGDRENARFSAFHPCRAGPGRVRPQCSPSPRPRMQESAGAQIPSRGRSSRARRRLCRRSRVDPERQRFAAGDTGVRDGFGQPDAGQPEHRAHSGGDNHHDRVGRRQGVTQRESGELDQG